MMTQMKCSARILSLMWLLWFGVRTSDSGTPASSTQAVPTTARVPETIVGKMSINDVELQYTGPSKIAIGTSAIVSLSTTNRQNEAICFLKSRLEDRFSFWVSVKSPKGKTTHGQTYGVACDLAGDGILMLDSGKHLEERLDLAKFLTDGPGDYEVTIMQCYGGVAGVPAYGLRLDVPLAVMSDNPDAGDNETAVKKQLRPTTLPIKGANN